MAPPRFKTPTEIKLDIKKPTSKGALVPYKKLGPSGLTRLIKSTAPKAFSRLHPFIGAADLLSSLLTVPTEEGITRKVESGDLLGLLSDVLKDAATTGWATDTWRPFREEQVKGGQGRVLKTEDDIVQTLADYGNPTDFEFTKTGVSLTKMVDRFGTGKRVKKTFKPGVAEEEVVSWLQDRRTGALPRRRLPKGEPHGGGSGK